MFSPRENDLKSLALHQLIVRKIEGDPVLFECVRQKLDSWRNESEWFRRPYLGKWVTALNEGVDVVLALAIEDSERGQVLRQASPFAGILSEAERTEFLISWSRRHKPE